MLNRRWMCALIWEPRPRTKRPELNDCRSFATIASVIGLRANATAIAVPSVNVRDRSAASSSGRNGARLAAARAGRGRGGGGAPRARAAGGGGGPRWGLASGQLGRAVREAGRSAVVVL